MSRIFVTGMGMISAIGDAVQKNREALIRKQSGISTLTLFNTKYTGLRPCGEIKKGTQELKDMLHAHEKGTTRSSALALHAFKEAADDAGLSAQQLSSPHTALIGGSTVGGMCLTDELYHDANRSENGSEYLSSYDCASVNLYLQKRYRMGGIINTINTACSSSSNAIMYGARLLKNGLAKCVIAGGTDSLAKFTINGFNALHILSPEKCAPFDRDRKGLNLGEAAAFLVLEKEEDIAGKKTYAELTGYGNSNDAFHPSSLSDEGDGPFLCMQKALEKAGLSAPAISFINAHGTATENNDAVESRAMLRLFGTPPPFASTKANTGHTLGAAGAVEAVFSVLSLYYQEIYPGLHFSNAIAATGLKPETHYRQMSLQHVMSNSFGFGGNCTSLIFSKV
ncbi:beta-ketoacyl-[acyl-carrier-protein] synthase family protein [Agriterribacter sp.]|uniref:beta-ketoacyl-[acyl-carrier-protein] synthase family protein n=1 Tax=Agriterribacter sp. TaxID=2821509 RepID=UPI002C90E81E|nr:beta-ketoacyl-[acyl-carrier-protein] synthase family protein [Agriterribacter sp.]HRO45202.1 beta-ketoacyl-[acyl-carrier-protein] synthase family protein [Agriterribacter sp.]HRQ16805.1 beta-ketoacyl-[acyl-carrier-protein] synthase family protein [Agriterribacter sp.]